MFKRYINKDSDGYVALITMLVILAVSSVIASALLVLGTDWLRTSQTVEEGTRARNAADSCTEAALALIAASSSFTGSGSITLSAYAPAVSCSYTVSGTAPTKTIVVSGVSNAATKKLTTITSQVTPSIIISSSQVVP